VRERDRESERERERERETHNTHIPCVIYHLCNIHFLHTFDVNTRIEVYCVVLYTVLYCIVLY
jgi:hypothetical protein